MAGLATSMVEPIKCLCGEVIAQRINFDGLWFDRAGGVAGEDGHPHAPLADWEPETMTPVVALYLYADDV